MKGYSAKVIAQLFGSLALTIPLLLGCSKAAQEEAPYTYVAQTEGAPKQIYYVPKGGFAMVEEDVILDTVEGAEQARKAFESGAHGRAGFSIDSLKRVWPEGRVPYAVDTKLIEFEQALASPRVMPAIEILEAETGFRFVPRTHEKDYVVFERAAITGSHIGRHGGRQPVLISDQASQALVMHELGHVVGLFHEHSRPDRDNFLTVNWENIDPMNWHQFRIPLNDGQAQGEYDFASIMHYGLLAFSLNGKPTMVLKGTPEIDQSSIGHAETFSTGDVTTIMDLMPSSCVDTDEENRQFNTSFRIPGTKNEPSRINAISVYKGVREIEEEPGVVHVTITGGRNRNSELVLASYEPVKWYVHATKGARLQRIFLVNPQSTVTVEGLSKDRMDIRKLAYPAITETNGVPDIKQAVLNAWQVARDHVDSLQTCYIGGQFLSSRKSWGKHGKPDPLPASKNSKNSKK